MDSRFAPPCIGCHTDCCSHYVVPLNAHDIYRIATSLGVAPASFVELHAATASPRAVDLWDSSYEVALRKRAGSEDCVFLLSLDESRRCGIQAFKPLSCAAYPFTLDADGDLWHRADMLCPRPWRLDTAAHEKATKTITQMRAEWRRYEELVARWNQGRPAGAGVTPYLDYLMSAVQST
jgi:Fe-S-cluster containining protein